MSRVYVFARYTPHNKEMSVVSSDGPQPSAVNASAESNADIFEIEVFKSQVVTIASCVFRKDSAGIGNVENIRYKSCGDRLPSESAKDFSMNSASGEGKKDTGAASMTVGHKARRFKRISLQWLLKPSRKGSHSSSRIRRVNGSGKPRVMRINSAPKSFGHGANSENDFTHLKENKAQNFDRNSHRDDVQLGGAQTRKGDTRKIRRISLPAHVSDVSRSGVDKRLAPASDISLPRTPEPRRKHVVEFDENFIQSLKIKDPGVVSDSRIKQRARNGENETENGKIAAGQGTEGKTLSTRDHASETFAQLKNVKRESTSLSNGKLTSRPVLKLHKFHNPDIFYMPLPDDESQTAENLSQKLCRARLIEPRTENSLIQECIMEELQAYLRGKQFCSLSCQRWCLELSQNIKTRVHRMKQCESKIVCVIYIAALRGHGVHAAAQCVLTPNDDNFITVNFKNRSMIAVASVLAIKYA